MDEKKHVLLVDDDERLVRSLSRRMRASHPEWVVSEAPSGQAALDYLATHPCDLVVSDIQMPVMDGAAFLAIVRDRHPKVVRFALSGHAQRDIMLKAVSLSHQYFSKPCDTEVLTQTIDAALKNAGSVHQTQLREVLVHLNQFPLAAPIYKDLVDALADSKTGAERIAEIVGRDPAMTSKVMHVANSSFFGSPHRIGDLQEAVTLLGTDAIRALAMMFKFLEGFRDPHTLPISLERLWEHSVKTSAIAAKIEEGFFGHAQQKEGARTVALLHDLGKLILADFSRDRYAAILQGSRKNQAPLWQLEEAQFEISHAEVGALLFELWGLPHDVCEMIRYHHVPSSAYRADECLTSLHIADVVDYCLSPQEEFYESQLDAAYMTKLALSSDPQFWVHWLKSNS